MFNKSMINQKSNYAGNVLEDCVLISCFVGTPNIYWSRSCDIYVISISNANINY